MTKRYDKKWMSRYEMPSTNAGAKIRREYFGADATSELSRWANMAYVDNVHHLANPAYVGVRLAFYHVGTGHAAEFAAFVTDFSDSYQPNWESTEVMGRSDPVMAFKNTTRSISLSWDVVAGSWHEATRNMAEVNRLIQFLYPSYSKQGGQNIMNGSPLVRVQFANLISSARDESSNRRDGIHIPANRVDTRGLFAAITSLNATPDLDAGIITGWNSMEPDFETRAVDDMSFAHMQFPKVWKIDCSMNVLHDHLMGFDSQDRFGENGEAYSFPYGGMSQENFQARDAEDTAANANLALEAYLDTLASPGYNFDVEKQDLDGSTSFLDPNAEYKPFTDMGRMMAEYEAAKALSPEPQAAPGQWGAVSSDGIYPSSPNEWSTRHPGGGIEHSHGGWTHEDWR